MNLRWTAGDPRAAAGFWRDIQGHQDLTVDAGQAEPPAREASEPMDE
jgi:hypothetical protein